MTGKKVLALITAIFAVFAFTGVAMAANRVEVKVTSEPIGFGATCDKAGGFSLEFDSGTVITAGDQITIDLDFKSPSVFAAICKDIDLEISAGGSGGEFTDANVDPVGANPTSPIYYDNSDTADDLSDDGGNGIYFRVKGAKDGQRITVDVLGSGFLMVGPDTGDKLILVFLDQKTNADWALDGIWVDNDGDGIYDDAATASDNTLCINVSAWDESTVDANMDSAADKFTFIPSDPQVAHIAAAKTFSFATCGGKNGLDVGRISCGSRGDQAIDTCTYFDFETGSGYVFGTRSGTPRLLINTNATFALVDYQIKMEILVNGGGGDNGVYFSNQVVRADGYDSADAACNDFPSSMPAVGATASYVYLNGAGSTLVNGNIEAPKTAAIDSCDVATTARAVTLTTNVDNLDLAGTNDYLQIDIPALNYDLDDITADDEVAIQVTVIKAPCGNIFTGTIMIGTMCAEPETPVQTSNTVVFPYFTAMDNDNWWDGFVVTNLSGTSGSFTALVYEQDGDMGAFTGTVDANGLYQNTLAGALAGASLVTAGSDGVLGNSLCYIIVCADFTADGFAFMGSLSSNALMSNESMGYIPRVDYYNSNDVLPFCTNMSIVPGVVPSN